MKGWAVQNLAGASGGGACCAQSGRLPSLCVAGTLFKCLHEGGAYSLLLAVQSTGNSCLIKCFSALCVKVVLAESAAG